MQSPTEPRPFPEWRTSLAGREEDAAYTFGYHITKHCRDEAMRSVDSIPLPTNADQLRAVVERAVDNALHGVMDLLEGFWALNSGAGHRVAYVLGVRVENLAGATVETVEISPSKVDLPIGYWKWKDGEFR